MFCLLYSRKQFKTQVSDINFPSIPLSAPAWLRPKCTFILLYTTLNLKARKIHIEKNCVTFLRGVRGSPEERSYDVSRGQNRYVTLLLQTLPF